MRKVISETGKLRTSRECLEREKGWESLETWRSVEKLKKEGGENTEYKVRLGQILLQ